MFVKLSREHSVDINESFSVIFSLISVDFGYASLKIGKYGTALSGGNVAVTLI